MKYTRDEAFEEVIRRSRAMKIRHERKVATIMSAAASCVAIAILFTKGVFDSFTGMSAENAYGSFLISPQAGGYVLASVIAFCAGVGVTIAIRRYRKDNDNNRKGSRERL